MQVFEAARNTHATNYLIASSSSDWIGSSSCSFRQGKGILLMEQNIEEQTSLHGGLDNKDGGEGGDREALLSSMPNQYSRPTSMVIKKAHTVIPAHLVAEAISTLDGLDLRWSGPITPSERQYVQQYVFAKYPEYCNGLVQLGDKIDLYNYSLCVNNNDESMADDRQRRFFASAVRSSSSSPPSFASASHSDIIGKIQLDPSKLLDILAKKTSFQGNFISIPEIQARNRALKNCGLTEEDYMVLFTQTSKEAMIMVGESYPFFRGNYYLTILQEEYDCVIRELVGNKDSKVIAAPQTWLDLRIKGSQLSQYFRRKCKYSPKGLFAYPACVSVNGTRSSMHWISEAHRNSWHVLLDATGIDVGENRLTLALHRPDFVLCTLDNMHSSHPANITCLLVRKTSFDTAPPPEK